MSHCKLALFNSTLKMSVGSLYLFLMASLSKGSATRRRKLEIYGRSTQNRTASGAEGLFVFEQVFSFF